jgi:mycofactocin system glycosyltransferase
VAAVAAASGARLVARPSSGGAGAARNAGAALAGTPLLAFVDADCVPAPGWLDALLPHFADPRVALVAPRIVAADEEGAPLTRYEAVRAPHDRGPAPARVVPGGRVPFVPGAALVARAAALGAGFDPSLRGGEDVDLVWRLTAAGHHVRYEPAARVAHAHRTAPRDWLARRASYGRGAAPLAGRHPGAARPLALSPWSAAAWLAVALGRPAIGVGITGAAAGTARARAPRLVERRGARGAARRPRHPAVRPRGRRRARAHLVAGAAAGALRSARLRRVMAAAALAGPLLDHRRSARRLDPSAGRPCGCSTTRRTAGASGSAACAARTPTAAAGPLVADAVLHRRGARRAGDTVARCQTFR